MPREAAWPLLAKKVANLSNLRVELRALYATICRASTFPWEHCPAGTYPLQATPKDLERLIPEATAASRPPPDTSRHNMIYRVRPGALLYGVPQGCYRYGDLGHFEKECPN